MPEREPLREALQRVAVALKDADVPFALAGGYAAWARGGPEPGHDVDFVTLPAEADRAAEALARAGLRVERPPEDWLFKAWCDEAMVDVLHCVAGRDVDEAMLRRAAPAQVMSIRMPVLCATDVVTTKLLALSEHDCDFGKVLPAARALREQVDWPAVSRAASASPYARAFLYLAEELRIV